ncbi:HNH endonuclease signature motif containing protein [Thalassococcus sp. S3]|uniref:HNH endonuclease signature motif containing protein n=1 Tax=Thalassococcus sp. S3 TaxID=2017482 RepID=UPI001024249F|nr:HNH endonuclease signature motif containing protein [Thalassococcus sp. S3]QBF31526.1 HNH endonuclease [Thalassococcus sp. S3]
MKGRAIAYSEAELLFIELTKELPRRDAHARFCAQFGRTDVSLTNYNALCKRKGWMTGRTGCFEPGQVPVNKGKKMPYNEASARTQFRKGHVPPNRKELGDERVGKDGYIEISVPIRNPYTGHSRRYMHKHRYLWELENGPLPEGMCLKSRDGDRTNCDPSNWIAIPRALLPRLNGRFGRNYDAAPAELKPLILKTALLEHEAREARKGERKRK